MKPFLKVCGITNEADAMAAAQAGVAYLGYVLNYRASPRFITPAVAQAMIQKVRRFYPKVQHVGVLVSPTTELIREFMPQVELDILQVYNGVPHSPLPIWQSTIIRTAEDVSQLKPSNETVVGLHCDAGLGSGQSIPTELLSRLQSDLPLIVAGGIGPENIEEVLRWCEPEVVDVNSKVESAPGKKDIAKIKALLKYMELCI